MEHFKGTASTSNTTSTDTSSSQRWCVRLTQGNKLLPQEMLRPTPSEKLGVSRDTETMLRNVACEIIQTGGVLLRLRQPTLVASQILFHRFFYAKAFGEHQILLTVMACVNIATKVELDQRRDLEDIINVFFHIHQKQNGLPVASIPLGEKYEVLREQILTTEFAVLKALGCCVQVKQPHKILMMYLMFLEVESKYLKQIAFNFLNDIQRLDVFVRFTTEAIVCACIWMAGRILSIPFPEEPPWYEVFEIDINDIEAISTELYFLYSYPKMTLYEAETKLEQDLFRQQQKIDLEINSAKNRLQGPSQFSPTETHSEKSSGEIKVRRNLIADSGYQSPPEASFKRQRTE